MKSSSKAGLSIGAGAGALALAAALIAPHEGNELQPYQDLVGKWTVCRGHTTTVDPNKAYAQEECDALFYSDLYVALEGVNRHLTVEVPESTRASFVSFVFNLGESNFARSTMLKKANAGDLEGACAQFDRWFYVGGKDCRIKASRCSGIIKRRADERKLCEAEL